MCNDKTKVMEMVKKNGLSLRTANEDLRADRDVVVAAVRQNGRSLRYASEELRADRDVVLEAVKQNWIALGYAKPELRNDNEIMLEAVRQDGTALQYYRRTRGRKWEYWHFPGAIMKEVRSQDCCNALEVAVPHGGCGFEEDFGKWCCFRETFKPKEKPVRSTVGMEHWDREATLDAVGTYGLALACANEAFKADREIVLAAVKQNGLALQCASEELRADREVILEAVKQNGLASQYASEELRADREVILEAVKQNGLASQYASEELRADRGVILTAVKQNGLALQYGSEELRADQEVVLAAVKQNGLALEYASEELRADREVILEAVKQNGLALEYANEELRADKELVLAAIRQDNDACHFIKSDLLSDKDVLLELARSYTAGSLYNPFSSVFYYEDSINVAYGDRDIVIELVKQNICDWNEVSRELCADKAFVLEALKCIEQGLKKDICFTFDICFENEVMKNIDVELRKDPEIQHALESVMKVFDNLRSSFSDDKGFEIPDKDSHLWKDRDFVLKAVKRYAMLLEYAPDFQSDDEITFTAVKKSGLALKFANAELSPGFMDKELVFEAVKQNGMALEFADARLRADKEVVLAAVNQDRNALAFVHKSLRLDKEVLLAAVSNGMSLSQIAMERCSVVLGGDIDLLRAQEDYKKRQEML